MNVAIGLKIVLNVSLTSAVGQKAIVLCCDGRKTAKTTFL